MILDLDTAPIDELDGEFRTLMKRAYQASGLTSRQIEAASNKGLSKSTAHNYAGLGRRQGLPGSRRLCEAYFTACGFAPEHVQLIVDRWHGIKQRQKREAVRRKDNSPPPEPEPDPAPVAGSGAAPAPDAAPAPESPRPVAESSPAPARDSAPSVLGRRLRWRCGLATTMVSAVMIALMLGLLVAPESAQALGSALADVPVVAYAISGIALIGAGVPVLRRVAARPCPHRTRKRLRAWPILSAMPVVWVVASVVSTSSGMPIALGSVIAIALLLFTVLWFATVDLSAFGQLVTRYRGLVVVCLLLCVGIGVLAGAVLVVTEIAHHEIPAPGAACVGMLVFATVLHLLCVAGESLLDPPPFTQDAVDASQSRADASLSSVAAVSSAGRGSGSSVAAVLSAGGAPHSSVDALQSRADASLSSVAAVLLERRRSQSSVDTVSSEGRMPVIALPSKGTAWWAPTPDVSWMGEGLRPVVGPSTRPRHRKRSRLSWRARAIAVMFGALIRMRWWKRGAAAEYGQLRIAAAQAVTLLELPEIELCPPRPDAATTGKSLTTDVLSTVSSPLVPLGAPGRIALVWAEAWLGRPYGVRPPRSFVGGLLVREAYREAEIELPPTGFEQAHLGAPVAFDDLELGDIVVLYGGGDSGLYAGSGRIVTVGLAEGVYYKAISPAMVYTARRITSASATARGPWAPTPRPLGVARLNPRSHETSASKRVSRPRSASKSKARTWFPAGLCRRHAAGRRSVFRGGWSIFRIPRAGSANARRRTGDRSAAPPSADADRSRVGRDDGERQVDLREFMSRYPPLRGNTSDRGMSRDVDASALIVPMPRVLDSELRWDRHRSDSPSPMLRSVIPGRRGALPEWSVRRYRRVD